MFFPVITRREAYLGCSGVYTYRKYKAEIVEDCKHRCVYCDGHGSSFGGHEMMELDHIRPKADHLFPKLRNEPTNLVLACRSCNGKKSDDWPAGADTEEMHVAGSGYIDPFGERRDNYFEVGVDGCLVAKRDPAGYMIVQLALNRPFAVAVRARRFVRVRLLTAIEDIINMLRDMAERPCSREEIIEIADLLGSAKAELQSLFDEDALN